MFVLNLSLHAIRYSFNFQGSLAKSGRVGSSARQKQIGDFQGCSFVECERHKIYLLRGVSFRNGIHVPYPHLLLRNSSIIQKWDMSNVLRTEFTDNGSGEYSTK